MKMICLYLCPCLFITALAFGQEKRQHPLGDSNGHVEICELR